MKKFRRVTALLMAMVMVLAMGVTSFAAENDTVTVNVKIQNPAYAEALADGDSTEGIEQYWFDGEVTLDADESLYTIADAGTVENYGTATAMDAIIQAVNDSDLTDKTIDCYRVQYTVYDPSSGEWVPVEGRYGIAFNQLSTAAGSSTTEGGVTTYKYWEVVVDGTSASDYATAYVADDNMTVEVNWSVFSW